MKGDKSFGRGRCKRGVDIRSLLPAGLVLLPLFLPAVAGARLVQEAANQPHLAYLDPGTGSFIVQALIAVLAGIAVTARIYWHKIKGFFGRGAASAEAEAESTQSTPEDDA